MSFARLGTLFASFFLLACVTTRQLYTPDGNAVYMHRLSIDVNGKSFKGVGVVPLASEYKIEVDPPGKIDRIVWRTCSREDVIDEPSTGWSGKFKFKISPTPGLEDVNSCALEIVVLEQKKRRNAFGLIEFQDRRPQISLPAKLSCNGVQTLEQGVAVCQSSAGLYQQIEFDVPVVQAGAEHNCDVVRPLRGNERIYRFPMAQGACTYYFVAKQKHENGERLALRLSTIGYTDVPPIKE